MWSISQEVNEKKERWDKSPDKLASFFKLVRVGNLPGCNACDRVNSLKSGEKRIISNCVIYFELLYLGLDLHDFDNIFERVWFNQIKFLQIITQNNAL